MITSHEAAQTLLSKGNASHRADAESIVAVANTLRAEGFDASEDGTGQQNLVPMCHDVAATLNSAFGAKMGLENQHIDQGCPNFVAFDCKGSQVHHERGGASPTLRAMAGAEAHANGGGQLEVAFHPTQDPISSEGVSHALSGNENATTAIATQWAVRRLTPVECERLMGFPDNWTQIPWRGKPAEQCPDGRRYKAIGNSWGLNAGEYIFDRMRWVESL